MAFDLRPLGHFILRSIKSLGAGTTKGSTPTRPPRAQRQPAAIGPIAGSGPGAYPGDFRGSAKVSYSPRPDGRPDPGEIVWSWVPYEEDDSRGKDRPVLLIGRDGDWLLGLMLTSKDHDGGPASEDYMDIGAGTWDPQRRPSEVKVDRIIRLDPGRVRREGAVLEKARFRQVAAVLRTRHGWS
ncbi:type II toxin-antitoxin system PemK/MazF family toxin [Arthrobacter sp. efr-133-TYG-104]|uniref:type II toxin-antitoxin system PemK/MazF family toxin n=1 Tax=Arthrobacter sp. efr-133-TYG-104 TaxID=3040324 RepID=UPI00254A4B37|nr:type II toxin-antitoxin system PemK/MazF family toxin [Arthrobacter sp. efr-133-TYG-104]